MFSFHFCFQSILKCPRLKSGPGPPQCKLFEQKQLSLSLNSHRSVPNSNLPAYLHPGWASPKCKVTSLVLTKLLPPLNCTPPLTITDPIAAFTGLLWNNIPTSPGTHMAPNDSGVFSFNPSQWILLLKAKQQFRRPLLLFWMLVTRTQMRCFSILANYGVINWTNLVVLGLNKDNFEF